MGHAEQVDELSTIASEPGWLRLLHYERDRGSATGWHSAIHSQEFFLSADGINDPLAELKSTLAALALPPSSDPDKHAQCQFPARFQWLKKRLGGEFASLDNLKCPGFEAWVHSGQVESLSIVYANGFLGNPASYYGHTLLKLNFKDSQVKTRLMDVSVNYGAILEGSHDSMVAYLIKCLIGGYDGGFSHINFYFHEHNYGDVELRDLWEYQLDLPQEAVDLVVAHAWEVLGKRYTYYFFKRNCAYRMAELLEVAEGLNVIPDETPWLVPQSMVQHLRQTQYRGKPLLAREIYHPSRQSRFYERYRNLSMGESALFKELVQAKIDFTANRYQEMPVASQQATVDAMLDYYQFIGSPIDDAPLETRQAYTQALSQRYRLAPGGGQINIRPPVSPQEGYPPGWGQIGWRSNSITGEAFSVRIRPAYYDALDTDSSHVLNSSLSMFDLRVNLRRDHIYLDRFDLVSIENVSPGISGLPGDDGVAWKIRLGAGQARLWCDDCPVVRLEGDRGYARQWTEAMVGALYVGGALQSNAANQGWGYAKASAVMIFHPHERLGGLLAYEHRFTAGGQEQQYGVARADLRWAIGSRNDLRLTYEHDLARLFGVGWGMYW